MNNRSQAVRLPKDFQSRGGEVYIRKHRDDVILSPRPRDWSKYLAECTLASPDFTEIMALGHKSRR